MSAPSKLDSDIKNVLFCFNSYVHIENLKIKALTFCFCLKVFLVNEHIWGEITTNITFGLDGSVRKLVQYYKLFSFFPLMIDIKKFMISKM